MAKQRFRFAYIDAFAGTGYRKLKDEETHQILIPELVGDEPESFLSGSVLRALEIEPHFHKYLLVEKDEKKCKELRRIRESYKNIKERIEIINQDLLLNPNHKYFLIINTNRITLPLFFLK